MEHGRLSTHLLRVHDPNKYRHDAHERGQPAHRQQTGRRNQLDCDGDSMTMRLIALIVLLAGTAHASWWGVLASSQQGAAEPAGYVMPQSNNMVVWWAMADNTRSNIPDWSGKGNVADLYDAQLSCTWSDGAWTLINTNTSQVHYFANRAANLLNGAYNRTLSFWVNFSKWGNAGAGQGLIYSHDGAGSYGMAQNGTSNTLYSRVDANKFTPNILPATNEWHLITMAVAGSAAANTNRIYVNADLVATIIGGGAISAVNDQWKIGNYDALSGWTLNAKVGPVMMWSNTLTGADVTNLFDIGRTH
jgi:hypothetical protein